MVLGILIGACMPFGFRLCSRPWVPVQVSGSSPWSQHHLPGLQATWLHDHLGAWPRLGRCSAGTHPHSRPGLCGRSVDVDASDTHATATSSVCEPFQGTERVSATNFPGMGGRGGCGEIRSTSAGATIKFNSPFAQPWQLKISAIFTNTSLS